VNARYDGSRSLMEGAKAIDLVQPARRCVQGREVKGNSAHTMRKRTTLYVCWSGSEQDPTSPELKTLTEENPLRMSERPVSRQLNAGTETSSRFEPTFVSCWRIDCNLFRCVRRLGITHLESSHGIEDDLRNDHPVFLCSSAGTIYRSRRCCRLKAAS